MTLRDARLGLVLGFGRGLEPVNRYLKAAEAPAPERPVTFRAAENLGAFELAELWSDRTAWPVVERTAYDELAELACMSALAKWLTRWQPIAIHGAVLAGARMEAIAGARQQPASGVRPLA